MSHIAALFGICPLTTAQEILSGKWKLLIIHAINNGDNRFCVLKRMLPGCTQTMLSNQLRSLERDGLITRIVFAEVPPHVEYELTPLGKQITPIIQKINAWGVDYIANSTDYIGERIAAQR
jgi:DNA-binding HxlR family transcriptional regulator